MADENRWQKKVWLKVLIPAGLPAAMVGRSSRQ